MHARDSRDWRRRLHKPLVIRDSGIHSAASASTVHVPEAPGLRDGCDPPSRYQTQHGFANPLTTAGPPSPTTLQELYPVRQPHYPPPCREPHRLINEEANRSQFVDIFEFLFSGRRWA